ncbi:uncharacterized protein KGF55_002094 [Candida pseudojiufengensis]|uniref:uncharacterized protein n=1 Tax=Candida pseudojiufengensis TaxID=497109 RepID=UPI0022255CAA|nr:uncharacterized protein KGF55_002094 [Candida pseudojiufengensis]KAI5964152.1 hypothetical protein KGF55_002094 [Candida pseudojiufengensis]
MKQILRYLSTRTKHSQFYAKSTINPIDFKLKPPSKFIPKSVLVFSTPSNLPQVIQDAIDLFQNNQLQVVVAGVDTMVPYSHRNGVSELWLDHSLKIGASTLLEEKDKLNEPPRESDGINAVSARKNWKNIRGSLNIKLRNEMNASISLANTVFSTGSIITLFYFDPILKIAHSGEHLCDLDIELPRGIISNHSVAVVEDKWTPLYSDEPFKVTNCVGNLLKTIEQKPAAKFLENNEKLMSLGSKDTEVYVKLRKQGTSVVERYKVTAGGGGWGPKADLIALSPEAKPKKGDAVEFFMIKPEDRYFSKHNDDDIGKYQNSIAFARSYEETTFNENEKEKEHIFENVFGCGSEHGFIFNGIKHDSPGEALYIKL